MPSDPYVPLTPPPEKSQTGWAERSEPSEGWRSSWPPPTAGWVQRAGSCLLRPLGRRGLREAPLNPPPQHLLRPARGPLPAGGERVRAPRRAPGLLTWGERGHAEPPAPAASIWPPRLALTPEVAPGPWWRRPFVSGTAWRRTSSRCHRPSEQDCGGSGCSTCPPHPYPGQAWGGLRFNPCFRPPTHSSLTYHLHI